VLVDPARIVDTVVRAEVPGRGVCEVRGEEPMGGTPVVSDLKVVSVIPLLGFEVPALPLVVMDVSDVSKVLRSVDDVLDCKVELACPAWASGGVVGITARLELSDTGRSADVLCVTDVEAPLPDVSAVRRNVVDDSSETPDLGGTDVKDVIGLVLAVIEGSESAGDVASVTLEEDKPSDLVLVEKEKPAWSEGLATGVRLDKVDGNEGCCTLEVEACASSDVADPREEAFKLVGFGAEAGADREPGLGETIDTGEVENTEEFAEVGDGVWPATVAARDEVSEETPRDEPKPRVELTPRGGLKGGSPREEASGESPGEEAREESTRKDDDRLCGIELVCISDNDRIEPLLVEAPAAEIFGPFVDPGPVATGSGSSAEVDRNGRFAEVVNWVMLSSTVIPKLGDAIEKSPWEADIEDAASATLVVVALGLFDEVEMPAKLVVDCKDSGLKNDVGFNVVPKLPFDVVKSSPLSLGVFVVVAAAFPVLTEEVPFEDVIIPSWSVDKAASSDPAVPGAREPVSAVDRCWGWLEEACTPSLEDRLGRNTVLSCVLAVDNGGGANFWGLVSTAGLLEADNGPEGLPSKGVMGTTFVEVEERTTILLSEESLGVAELGSKEVNIDDWLDARGFVASVNESNALDQDVILGVPEVHCCHTGGPRRSLHQGPIHPFPPWPGAGPGGCAPTRPGLTRQMTRTRKIPTSKCMSSKTNSTKLGIRGIRQLLTLQKPVNIYLVLSNFERFHMR
jgi:hypothetical protein